MAERFLDAYAAYWSAVRREVCSVCLDCRDDGECGLSGRVCSLRSQLPRIVDVVFSTQSPRMDEYFGAIGEHVCRRCPEQDGKGVCKVRGRGECALDSYLPLVVSAIEEVPVLAHAAEVG